MAVNLKKSVKVAMANKEVNQEWLAVQLNIKPPAVTMMMQRNECGFTRLNDLADVFGMKVSEFIALGEG